MLDTYLVPEMQEIGISLVNSFRCWPQGVLIHKSVVIICRICTQVREEIVLAKTDITILHDMRAIRIVTSSPCFNLKFRKKKKKLILAVIKTSR